MSHFLTPVTSEVFSMSIMEGIFPICLKIGYVITIFKSGKKIRQLTTDQSLLYLS